MMKRMKKPRNIWGRRFLSGVLAVTMGAGLLVASPIASADNRAYLRRDNSRAGFCTWDKSGPTLLQNCWVNSPSMHRKILVQIKPASRGGNAGLYLLDGLRARDDYNIWSREARAHNIFAHDNITLVMPVGGRSSFYADWYSPSNFNDQKYTYKWETFLTRELPPYLQRNFGVSPNNNSIGGLSMSGSAALTLAGFHRNQFKQALSFSGYLHPAGLGMKTAIRLAMLSEQMYNVDNMWGLPWDPAWDRHDPFIQAERLRGLNLYLSSGFGIPGAHNNLGDILRPISTVSGISLESLAGLSHIAMDLNLLIRGIPHVNAYHILGVHSAPYWRDRITDARPYVLNAMNAW